MDKEVTLNDFEFAGGRRKPYFNPITGVTITAIPIEEVEELRQSAPIFHKERDEDARALKAATTRIMNLEKCFGPPHRWQPIRKGYDPNGKHSLSGYLVKNYIILRCLEHPECGEVVAGKGEAKLYADLKYIRKPKRKKQTRIGEW